MTRGEWLTELRGRLQARHGARLRGAVLYGSEARGEASVESDIDLLVLLEEPIDYGRDLEANMDAVYPLSLRLRRRISAKPVGVLEYDSVDCPLYRAAHEEGVLL